MFNNIYNGKKVLVTGHTGFKGSWLSTWLKELGADVVGLSGYVPSKPAHYDYIKDEVFNADIEADIRNFESLEKALSEHKPEVIFHLAANPIVSECYRNPREAFETNLMGTVNLLDAIRNNDCVKAAVFITSDKCYENVEWYFGYKETDHLGGIDPYSATKACAEIAISSMTRSFMNEDNGVKISSARAGNVIGGGDWALNRIIPDIVKQWYNKETLSLRSPHSTRPWQHVLEPLSGYLALGAELLAGNDEVRTEAFNFGPRENVDISVQDVVENMAKYIDGKWKVETNHNFKKEAGLLKLNCDKARFLLDWHATLNFEDTIEFTALWYKKFYEEGEAGTLEFTRKQIAEYCSKAKELGLKWTV
jgi:CDP-glucose 4,6-dehydratase